MILRENITHTPLTGLGLKLVFAAVDLAPNEQLESGLSIIDRDLNLVRIDKIYKDKDILAALDTMGPANGLIVLIDMPRSLSIPGRWRQEQVKLHPGRLEMPNGKVLNRFDMRGLKLYDALVEKGALPFLYFNYWTKLNYKLNIPFRSRSSQGCRALQTAIEHQLKVKNLPQNLAASAVLDAMVGAYAAWSVWAGKPEQDYEIYQTESRHRILIPKGLPHLRIVKPKRVRLFRKSFRAQSEYSKKISVGNSPAGQTDKTNL